MYWIIFEWKILKYFQCFFSVDAQWILLWNVFGIFLKEEKILEIVTSFLNNFDLTYILKACSWKNWPYKHAMIFMSSHFFFVMFGCLYSKSKLHWHFFHTLSLRQSRTLSMWRVNGLVLYNAWNILFFKPLF